MRKPFFTGTCTALVTPFLGERINYPMLQRLLQRQIDAGIKAVVICGTTGEAPTLSDTEKITMFRKAKEFVSDRLKIIAGTGSNCTLHAIELSVAAETAGVDALLVVSPYYNKATPDGLCAHYASIAHAVNIPVILYNVPSRTGLDMSVDVYKRLARIPNIIGVKEASSDVTKVTRIRNACGEDFSVWAGNDDLAVPCISLGGKGVISVTSNVAPAEVSAMTDAALDGDSDTAAALQSSLQPLNDMMFCEINPIPVKAAMKIIGFDCGSCRLPLTTLSVKNTEKLTAMLR